MPQGYALLVATKEGYIMVLNFTDPFLTTRVLGFENLFDRLQRFSETTERSSSYPPYNIRRDANRIFIDVAVAGLAREDLNIELAEGILTGEDSLSQLNVKVFPGKTSNSNINKDTIGISSDVIGWIA